MKKIYLIILGPDTDKNFVLNRINAIGENITFWENHILVSSDKVTASELYNEIVGTGENKTMVILDLNQHPGYWGYANKSIWTWIDEH